MCRLVLSSLRTDLLSDLQSDLGSKMSTLFPNRADLCPQRRASSGLISDPLCTQKPRPNVGQGQLLLEPADDLFVGRLPALPL